MTQWYYDCPKCGDIGKVEFLNPHDTRPMPMDIGFCPKCNAEQRDLFSEEDIRMVLATYEEDADAFLALLI